MLKVAIFIHARRTASEVPPTLAPQLTNSRQVGRRRSAAEIKAPTDHISNTCEKILQASEKSPANATGRERDRRLMMGDTISLRNAPGHFVTQDWLRLVQLKGSESGAIDALSRPEPSIIVSYRRQSIAEGKGSAEAWVAEEAARLAQKIIVDMRALAALGRIFGHGTYSGTGLRQPIPSELWPGLTFDLSQRGNSDIPPASTNVRYWG
jgi:hypothetical protein